MFCFVILKSIEIANNSTDRKKHNKFDRNNIKDNLDFSVIKVPYKSVDQLTENMTHSVSGTYFHTSLPKLDICVIFAPTS